MCDLSEILPVPFADRAAYGQIINGILDCAGGCLIVDVDDFGEQGWNAEAWFEFLDALNLLRERFGSYVVSSVVGVWNSFNPSDPSSWPEHGIVARFGLEFFRLFAPEICHSVNYGKHYGYAVWAANRVPGDSDLASLVLVDGMWFDYPFATVQLVSRDNNTWHMAVVGAHGEVAGDVWRGNVADTGFAGTFDAWRGVALALAEKHCR